jgi:hypothetical protein
VNVRIAFLALALAIAAAQLAPLRAQIEPGNASPDARLVRNEEGFAFDLAGGFRLGMHKDGYYLLGSKTIPGLILIKALSGLTAAELNRSLRSGYADRTVHLTGFRVYVLRLGLRPQRGELRGSDRKSQSQECNADVHGLRLRL